MNTCSSLIKSIGLRGQGYVAQSHTHSSCSVNICKIIVWDSKWPKAFLGYMTIFLSFAVPFLLNFWTKWHKTKQIKKTGPTIIRLHGPLLAVKSWVFDMVKQVAELSEYDPRSSFWMAWLQNSWDQQKGPHPSLAHHGTSNYPPLKGGPKVF